MPVGPDVVVLCVFGEHAGEEGEFAGGHGGDVGHYYLAVVPARIAEVSSERIGGLVRMVPDLEVLVVSYGNRVQPFELLNKIFL